MGSKKRLPQMAGGSASALSLFEACSGFTHVTARRIAQPPKATFVTRLRPYPVTQMSRSSATGSIDNSPGGTLLHM
jgi:hypothetical protein